MLNATQEMPIPPRSTRNGPLLSAHRDRFVTIRPQLTITGLHKP